MEPEGIGSVEAANSLYGQKFNGRNKSSPSISGELQKAQMDMGRIKETKNSAEKDKARAEFELFKARSAARVLALEIEKSNAKARSRKFNPSDQKYSELMRELTDTKQELSRLKLDVAAAVESKANAEKMIEDSNARAKSYVRYAEEMSKEIEEANEEHVLVELARIEAERETRELEAQRKGEADRFFKEIEATRQRIALLQKEANQAKDLEAKLAVTESDLSVLQSEMEFVRAMERSFQEKKFEGESKLNEAKKELASIKAEAFRFMTSMDVLRKELMFIAKQTEQSTKQEKNSDSTIQQLNSRLLKAKSKLESALAAEERSRAIISNLSSALQQLQKEKDEVEKQKEMIGEETARTKLKIELSEKKICSAEEKLQSAMVELEARKASEAIALKKLREVVERTMKSRTSSFERLSKVTISKQEHEYLSKRAELAQEVADKKVEAAMAWIEALKAEEREILVKAELVEKEMKELKVAQQKSLADNKNVSEAESPEPQPSTPAASKKENRPSLASARKAKVRRSSVSSNLRHNARSPSFTIKKKRTVMPNLAKLLKKR